MPSRRSAQSRCSRGTEISDRARRTAPRCSGPQQQASAGGLASSAANGATDKMSEWRYPGPCGSFRTKQSQRELRSLGSCPSCGGKAIFSILASCYAEIEGDMLHCTPSLVFQEFSKRLNPGKSFLSHKGRDKLRPSRSPRLCPGGRRCIGRILRPDVLGVAPAHVTAHIRP